MDKCHHCGSEDIFGYLYPIDGKDPAPFCLGCGIQAIQSEKWIAAKTIDELDEKLREAIALIDQELERRNDYHLRLYRMFVNDGGHQVRI